MKYAAEFCLAAGNNQALESVACVPDLLSIRQDHWTAYAHLQSAAMALDGTRLFNLLEDCRRCYGRLAREHALHTLLQWRDGQPTHPDDTARQIFKLLPSQLLPTEKLKLFRALRQQWIADLPRSHVSVTIWRGDDLLAISQRIAGSVKKVQEAALPADLAAALGWLTDAEGLTLGTMALEMEQYLAAHRLAAVMVQIATLARLHTLTCSQVTIRVQARMEIPTLTVHVRFQPCFWRDASLRSETDSGRTLLMRLQDIALRPQHTPRHGGFMACVIEDLTPRERERLSALAAAEGIRTESLLHEIHAQTLAARHDIEATAAAVERMKAARVRGKVVSEHTASYCTARIEIRNGGFPLTRFAPFLM